MYVQSLKEKVSVLWLIFGVANASITMHFGAIIM